MTKEQVLAEMDECLDCASVSGFEEQVDNLLKIHSEEETSLIIAQYLMGKYSAYKADGLATYLEAAIRKQPTMALVKHPENPFFKLAVIRGSKDLYDCYMEEAIHTYLESKDEDTRTDFYYELFSLAEKMAEMIFQNYEPRVKGLHYNGAIPSEESHLVKIDKDDFGIIEDIVEQYNGMIGRREILKDLNRKIENDFKR
jgi:hypothetical protein